MGAKEIMSKKFDMGLKGYKTEEVEEFLREVSLEFKRLQDENENLEKKLELLADKIREYREDEDTLKDALLGAQRQGNALIADSKRKAAEIVESAQANSAEILKKAEDERQKLQEKGENEIAAAREKATSIIDEANEKASEIEMEMNLKTDVQKEILHRTTSEVLNFKARILSSYKEQMGVVEKIVDECENEFIKKTLKDGKPDFKKYSSDKKNTNNNGNANNNGNKNKVKASTEVNGSSDKETSSASESSETPNESSIKFEVDMSNNTEEITLFDSKSDGANDSKTDDIFFKKSQDSKSKKQIKFGGNN